MSKPFKGFLCWVDCDLEVLWVEFKQILHLKVGCSYFGPVRDRGSIPYLIITSDGVAERMDGHHHFFFCLILSMDGILVHPLFCCLC